jgi:hypothetical protein
VVTIFPKSCFAQFVHRSKDACENEPTYIELEFGSIASGALDLLMVVASRRPLSFQVLP